MNKIQYLKPGDLILIVAPAKAIEQEHVFYAKDFLESKGFNVEIGPNCLKKHYYFSGTDEERTSDFQWAIDHTEAKAILCARGGYGSVRIIDRLQWANQLRFPKWIIGFSDITVFHNLMSVMEIPSIHGTMPLNFMTNSQQALDTLIQAIQGESYTIKCPSSNFNKLGTTSGIITGGNLSIVYSLLGTDLQPNYKNKILYLEDVGEQLYALDRMLYSLKKASILDQISGLIIGGMTDVKDTTTDTIGMQIEDIVLQHFEYRNIPICFNFPAGHIDDNRAVILGKEAVLTITENRTELHFSNEATT